MSSQSVDCELTSMIRCLFVFRSKLLGADCLRRVAAADQGYEKTGRAVESIY